MILITCLLGACSALSVAPPVSLAFTSSSASTAPPITASSASSISDILPTASSGVESVEVAADDVISLCTGYADIRHYDGTTGELIARNSLQIAGDMMDEPGDVDPHSGETGSFSATGLRDTSTGLHSCGSLSYSSAFLAIAGLDNYPGGDVVPALVDTTTGRVIDLVEPEDHAGFTSKEPIKYYSAAFNPYRLDMWYLRKDPSDEQGLILHGPVDVRQVINVNVAASPSYEVRQPQDYVIHTDSLIGDSVVDDWSIQFLQDASKGYDPDAGTLPPAGYVPALMHDDGAPLSFNYYFADGSGADSLPHELSRYADPNILPNTDYRTGTILKSAIDNGANSAFLASPARKNQLLLFTIPTTGGEPKQIADVIPPSVSTTSDVIPAVLTYFG